jgi:hypothetical protein
VSDWPVARVEGRLERLSTDSPGYFGLVCGRDNQTYYAALLFTGGGYVFLRIVEGASTVIARDETPIPGLPASGPIDMAFECASGEGMTAAALTLEVEGRPVAAVSDEPGLVALRRAGVYAESAPEGRRFRVLADDLTAYVGLTAAAAPPSVGPTPTPRPSDPGLDALIVHVPAAIRPTCARAAVGGNGAVASVICRPGEGIETVRYTQYISENLMDAAYRIDLANYGSGATGSSCETGPANGPYTIGGLHAGQVLCFEHLGRAWIVWTDVRLDILASANRIDASFVQLYDWWAEAGPVR